MKHLPFLKILCACLAIPAFIVAADVPQQPNEGEIAARTAGDAGRDTQARSRTAGEAGIEAGRYPYQGYSNQGTQGRAVRGDYYNRTAGVEYGAAAAPVVYPAYYPGSYLPPDPNIMPGETEANDIYKANQRRRDAL